MPRHPKRRVRTDHPGRQPMEVSSGRRKGWNPPLLKLPLTRKMLVGTGAVVVVAGVGIGLAATASGAPSSATACRSTKQRGAVVAALDEAEHAPISEWATPTFGALVTHDRLPRLPAGSGWQVVSSQPSGPVIAVTLAHNGELTEVPVAVVCTDGRWRISDQGVATTHPSSAHAPAGTTRSHISPYRTAG